MMEDHGSGWKRMDWRRAWKPFEAYEIMEEYGIAWNSEYPHVHR